MEINKKYHLNFEANYTVQNKNKEEKKYCLKF